MYKNIAFAVLALSVVVAMVVDDVLSPSAEEVSAEVVKEKKPAPKNAKTEADEYSDEYDEYDDDEDYYDDEEENDNVINSKRSAQENSNVEIADSDEGEVEIFVDEPRRKSPHASREPERTGGQELPSGLGSAEGTSGEAQ